MSLNTFDDAIYLRRYSSNVDRRNDLNHHRYDGNSIINKYKRYQPKLDSSRYNGNRHSYFSNEVYDREYSKYVLYESLHSNRLSKCASNTNLANDELLSGSSSRHSTKYSPYAQSSPYEKLRVINAHPSTTRLFSDYGNHRLNDAARKKDVLITDYCRDNNSYRKSWYKNAQTDNQVYESPANHLYRIPSKALLGQQFPIKTNNVSAINSDRFRVYRRSNYLNGHNKDLYNDVSHTNSTYNNSSDAASFSLTQDSSNMFDKSTENGHLEPTSNSAQEIHNDEQDYYSEDYNKSPDSENRAMCMSPQHALKLYWKRLTQYERREILQYPEVYFLGLGAKKRHPVEGLSIAGTADYSFASSGGMKKPAVNISGFDDAESGYIISMNDHVAYRYEITKVLGKGSFGQVVQAHDHRTGQDVALKIIRSEERFARQAQEELKILQVLNAQDIGNTHNIVRLLDHFNFRRHVCMVFELLSMNLYELLHRNEFKGLKQATVCKLTRGILDCLVLLYDNQIIHCDLKPENVLLRSAGRGAIKVIDFGSSCFADKRVYTYIQSRFYRAPEIILGMPYATSIDMWSLGCIVAELITGMPLFPGENESDQLACIMELLNVPPEHILDSAKRRYTFFTSSGEPRYMIEQQHLMNAYQNGNGADVNGNDTTSQTTNTSATSAKRPQHSKIRRPPGSVDLIAALTTPKRSSVCVDRVDGSNQNGTHRRSAESLDPDLVDFIQNCLQWSPEDRMTPAKALLHPWIVKHQGTPSSDASSVRSPTHLRSEAKNSLTDSGIASTVTNYPITNLGIDAEELARQMQEVRVRPKPQHDSRKYRQSWHVPNEVESSSGRLHRFSINQHSTWNPYEYAIVKSHLSRNLSTSERKKQQPELRHYRAFLNDTESNDGELIRSGSLAVLSGNNVEVPSRYRPKGLSHKAAGNRSRRLSSPQLSIM